MPMGFDLLSFAEIALRQGSAATQASIANQIMSQPEVQEAAMRTGERVAAEGLAQQLLSQKEALAKSLQKNKTYIMIAGAVVIAGAVFYFARRKK